MSDEKKKQPSERDRRQARLERALRENLKKRKGLARKRTAAPTSGVRTDPSSPPEAASED